MSGLNSPTIRWNPLKSEWNRQWKCLYSSGNRLHATQYWMDWYFADFSSFRISKQIKQKDIINLMLIHFTVVNFCNLLWVIELTIDIKKLQTFGWRHDTTALPGGTASAAVSMRDSVVASQSLLLPLLALEFPLLNNRPGEYLSPGLELTVWLRVNIKLMFSCLQIDHHRNR